MPFNDLLNGIKEAYQQYKSGNSKRPEASVFSSHPYEQSNNKESRALRQKHGIRSLGIGGIVLVALALWLVQPQKKLLEPRAAVAENTSQMCPTGVPRIVVTSVQLLPDPDLDPPSQLYMVTGVITNSTTATLSVSGIGFYLGQADPLRPPDWTDSMENMDVSGDPTQIPVGASLQWRDKQVEILDDPAGTNVSAKLSYPDSFDSRTGFQWNWPDANTDCPSPNVFDN